MVKKVRFKMELVREVFRLKWQEKKSNRLIGSILKISKSTVASYLTRAVAKDIDNLDKLNSVGDEELKKIIFPHKFVKEKSSIDFKRIHREFKRKHMTLMLLWEEESDKENKGILSYSHFCRLYRKWRKSQKISMKQTHKAGEKSFIDYAGSTVPVVINIKTGETREAQIFIISLGASRYTYMEATWTQETKNFLQSHINALEFFGGVSEIWVPDNLKTGINKSSKYEPELNKSYYELAKHYGAVIIPARVRKPKDKAIVENAVLHTSHWILAKIRDMKFFSLESLNDKLQELLVLYNNKNMQGLDDSRKSLFEKVERSALKPLPSQRFEIAVWKNARANIDYHVELDGSYYSVPYKLRGEILTIRHTDVNVEILHQNKRVALHTKLFKKRMASTNKDHMPAGHRECADWTPSRILSWAKKTGPFCWDVCKKIMATREHPELGFRSCMGIIRLGKRFSNERLENACRRSLSIGGLSYQSIKSILEKGLDKIPLRQEEESKDIKHENIRGNTYYQ